MAHRNVKVVLPSTVPGKIHGGNALLCVLRCFRDFCRLSGNSVDTPDEQ